MNVWVVGERVRDYYGLSETLRFRLVRIGLMDGKDAVSAGPRETGMGWSRCPSGEMEWAEMQNLIYLVWFGQTKGIWMVPLLNIRTDPTVLT